MLLVKLQKNILFLAALLHCDFVFDFSNTVLNDLYWAFASGTTLVQLFTVVDLIPLPPSVVQHHCLCHVCCWMVPAFVAHFAILYIFWSMLQLLRAETALAAEQLLLDVCRWLQYWQLSVKKLRAVVELSQTQNTLLPWLVTLLTAVSLLLCFLAILAWYWLWSSVSLCLSQISVLSMWLNVLSWFLTLTFSLIHPL